MAGTELLIMLMMILFNSVFAGYELALASVNVGRLTILAQERRRGAQSALRMKQKMEASLAVVQLGITLVGAIAAATGGAGAEEYIEPKLLSLGISASVAQILAISLIVLPLTLITIVFGELVPKVFALRNKEWVCLRMSPVMEWFARCVWPVVWLLEKAVTLIMQWGEARWRPKGGPSESDEVTLQELRAVAALARTSRLIGLREENIILNAARLSSTPVRAIMLPAEHISMLHLDVPLSTALIAAHHDMHTRFPVTTGEDEPQAIIGYVNFKDIVTCMRTSPHEPSLRGILRPLLSLHAEQSVASCLEKLIHERTHIALVRGTDKQVVGMVTLEDMLEELVGEIHDEYDRLPTQISRTGRGWIVGGGTNLRRLEELTGIALRSEDSKVLTVNDWVLHKLSQPVEGGETIHEDGLRLIVRKERRHCVLEAYLEQTSNPPGLSN